LDDVLSDREPEAGPAFRTGSVCFVEALKDTRQIIRRYAYSGIMYDDQDPLTLGDVHRIQIEVCWHGFAV
jgi:hypothetical protein